NYNIDFKISNERGELELGVGIGVISEVYTLFWNELSISVTIGDRERVPFVRHDHFVEEWESVRRILMKGFKSVSYFPTFLSNAFLCYCLFGNQLNDFLERYQRRKVVNNKNIGKVTLKISKQELVQKPHLIIVALHPFLKQLPKNSQFQSIPVIKAFYDSR
ncbi:unnamed protein product, partial [Porites evermanni]